MVLHTKIPPDLLAFVFDASIMRLRLMNNDRHIRQPSEILHLDAVMILHAQLTVDKTVYKRNHRAICFAAF